MNQQQQDLEPVPRIQPKPQYDWSQDTTTIRIRLNLPNTLMKNILVEVADLVLKINVTDRKIVKTLDLWQEVQLRGISTVYANNILEVSLIKQVNQSWPQLLVGDLEKSELIKRRLDAFQRKEVKDQEYFQSVKDLKQELDTHSTNEQMKLDDIQRKRISDIKTSEKEKALNSVYENLDNNSQFQQPVSKVKEPIQKNNEIIQEDDYKTQGNSIQNIILQKPVESYVQLSQPTKIQAQPPKIQVQPQKAIFEESDLIQNVIIPEVRNTGGAFQIPFTERIYPNLAAREQHFKDAPLPRQNKKFSKDDKENNPIFLKDKGDEFYQNKDYYSAINAYSTAFRSNNTILTCLSNRAACFLNLFNYEECIFDSDALIELYNKDKQEKYYPLYLKAMLRRAICYGWRGALDESKKIFEELIQIMEQSTSPLKEEYTTQCKLALVMLSRRQESNQFKRQADYCFKTSQYTKALSLYKQSYEIDENEFSLGNTGLIYLKQNDMEESLRHTERAIQKVSEYLQYNNSNPQIGKQSSQQSNDFLVKLYMRQAKCYFVQQKLEDALQAIKAAINLDEQNQEARDILNQIQKKQTKKEALQIKEEAAERLKAGKINDSLILYNECLKILTPQDDLYDFLAVLLNKCICCLHLQQYDEIIGSCVRGLKLITSQKNKVLSFEKQTKEDKIKLNEYHVRFLVRRSNAYLKQNQIYHASCDLDEAYKLDPTNQSIKNDIEKLKKVT